MENMPAEERPRDPNLEEARQHARAARREMGKTIEAFLPARVIEHRRAARREFLLALRSLVNAAIDRVEGDEDPSI